MTHANPTPQPHTDASDAPLALVTGGGAGIGREIALAFAAAGWRVHICGRNEAPLIDTAATSPLIDYTRADITDAAQVDQLFAAATRRGPLAAVILNAGLPGQPAEFGDTDLADFRAVIETNVHGTFLCARQAFAILKTQFHQGLPAGRSLVNCSIAAARPRPHTAAYATSKSAVAGMAHVMALDGRDHGVLVTRVDIGNAETELLRAFTDTKAEETTTTPASTAATPENPPHPAPQPAPEPSFNARYAAEAFVSAASLPASVVVDHLTITAAGMPFLGRG